MKKKKILSLILAVMLVFQSFASVVFADGEVEDVHIDGDSSVTIQGENPTTVQFSAYCHSNHGTDELASEQSVTWSLGSNDNGNLVTINQSGLLTIQPSASADSLQIIATSVSDPSIMSFHVFLINTGIASRIDVDGDDTIQIPHLGNITSQYTATAFDSTNMIIVNDTPTFSLDGTYTGVSINPSTGLVTVSDTAQDGLIGVVARSGTNNDVTYTKSVMLEKQATATRITISGSQQVQINISGDNTTQYTAVAYDDSDNVLDNAPIDWSLQTPYSGVSIDNNATLVISSTANEGSVTIVATSQNDSSINDTFTVNLVKQVILNPTSIDIVGNNTVTLGSSTATLQLTATVKDQFNNDMQGESVSWSISPALNGVSINSNGLITATNSASSGTVNIIAVCNSDGSIEGNKAITITKVTPVVSGISVNGLSTIAIDSSLSLIERYTAVITDQLGDVMTSEGVTWSLQSTYTGVSMSNDGYLTVGSNAIVTNVLVVATSTTNNSIIGTKTVALSKNGEMPPPPPPTPTPTPTPTGKNITIVGDRNIVTSVYGNVVEKYDAEIRDNEGNLLTSEHATLQLINTNSSNDIRLTRLVSNSTTNFEYLLDVRELATSTSVTIVATLVSDSTIKTQITVTVTSNKPASPTTTPTTTTPSSPSSSTTTTNPTPVVIPIQVVDAMVDKNISVVGAINDFNGTVMSHDQLNTKLETIMEGHTIAKATLTNTAVAKAIKDHKGVKELIVPMQYVADTQMVIIGYDALQTLSKEDVQLAISTKGVKLIVPNDIVNLYTLSSKLNTSVSKVSIGIKVSPATEAQKSSMTKYSDKRMYSNIESFELVALDTSGYEVKITDFGDKMVKGEFPLLRQNLGSVGDYNKLNVYKFNEQTKKWEYRQSKTNISDNKVVFYTSNFSSYALFENCPKFVDLENHWSKYNVELIASKHIIDGKGFGIFDPDGEITRAEFLALVVRALRLDGLASKASFEDVAPADWFSREVDLGVRYGIIDDGKSFRPNENVSREDMAVMVVRAYDKINAGKPEKAYYYTEFSDINIVDSKALDSVKRASSLGIMQGSGGKCNPKASATRAEGATLIYRLFKVSEIL
jgi:hypothetical protein